MADTTQIRQVFTNLLSNAIWLRKPDVPPEIPIAAKPLDGMVQFSVADNVIGIEPEYRDQIFTLFKRLHGREQYPGTGIGLAIVKRIIEPHGGKIWVESEPGRVSPFYFTIPDMPANVTENNWGGNGLRMTIRRNKCTLLE